MTISLLKSGREILVTYGFNVHVNAVMKQRSGRYERDRKPTPGWVLPLRLYRTVVQDLQALKQGRGLDIKINGLPKWVISAMTAPEWATHDLLAREWTAEQAHETLRGCVPLSLLQRLMPYQLAGVICAVRRRGRVLWCDEMGLGKTVQALVTALCFRSDWPLLVICPSSLKLTWAHEISKWLGLGDDAVQVVENSKEKLTHAVVIASYDLARAMAKEVQRRQFRFVIADEAHYLKSRQAARTKTLVPVIQRAKRALLLSGTPALSRPIELFQQLRALRRDVFAVEVAFGQRYCNSHMTAFGWCHDGSTNEEELHALLQRTVMIRRDKRTVLSSLPPKTRQTVLVDCSAKERKEIKALMLRKRRLDGAAQHNSRSRSSSSSSSRGGGGSSKVAEDLHGVTLKLFQLTGQGKLKACVAYVLEQLTKGAKMLLFAHHQPVMDGMMQALCEKSIRHVRIDGSTPSALRNDLATKFQTDDACRAALLSITAAGTGLTLHAATLVVFLELYWNPGQLLQAEDRAHRVGQRCAVDVKYMLCRNTLDESMWQKVEHKMAIVGRTVKGASESMEAARTAHGGRAAAAKAGKNGKGKWKGKGKGKGKQRGREGADANDDDDEEEEEENEEEDPGDQMALDIEEEGQRDIASFFKQADTLFDTVSTGQTSGTRVAGTAGTAGGAGAGGAGAGGAGGGGAGGGGFMRLDGSESKAPPRSEGESRAAGGAGCDDSVLALLAECEDTSQGDFLSGEAFCVQKTRARRSDTRVCAATDEQGEEEEEEEGEIGGEVREGGGEGGEEEEEGEEKEGEGQKEEQAAKGVCEPALVLPASPHPAKRSKGSKDTQRRNRVLAERNAAISTSTTSLVSNFNFNDDHHNNDNDDDDDEEDEDVAWLLAAVEEAEANAT